ncbi:MAG: desulfoferrodoxin family protein [Eubacteriales bacterium]|nr:desulfoferrodoxin family protein [Eubacteriales bacterium]
MIKLFKCSKCGSIVIKLNDAVCNPACCGQPMDLLEPNTVDAAQEKHVPVAEIHGGEITVKVGSVQHPMTDEHYIAYIFLETRNGIQTRALSPSDTPEAVFEVAEGDRPIAVYEYCTLHGFWKTDL